MGWCLDGVEHGGEWCLATARERLSAITAQVARQGRAFQVGHDLFHDGVVTVVGLGEQHRLGAVGEHRVVPVDTEQFVLTLRGWLGVEAFDPGARPTGW